MEGKSQNFLGSGHGSPLRMRQKINIPSPSKTYAIYRQCWDLGFWIEDLRFGIEDFRMQKL